MGRGLLWTLFLINAALVALCVAVLVREVRRALQRRAAVAWRPMPTFELPEDFVLVPAGWRRRPEPEPAPPVRLVA